MKTMHRSSVNASKSKFRGGFRSLCIALLCVLGIARAVAEDAPAPIASFPLELPGGVHEIVFCTRTSVGDPHWYANFGYVGTNSGWKYYGSHGRLCIFDVRDGRLTTLIEDINGALRDPAVSYDAKRILFSWRKQGTDYYHLFECDTDGANQRQLTFGPWDDFEGCYLPDGGIVFVSSRSRRWVNCYKTQVATIFRCDSDGKNIRSPSGNIEQDNSPWMLPDGRLIYTRWEYVDRRQVSFHQLWTMNPDGAGQMVYFGNMHRWTLMIDAKPIPGTKNVVAAISDFHGHADHLGRVSILNNANGPDGSANFEVPANRSIQLAALDENNHSVKRMQSFLSAMPGEVNSCVASHEKVRLTPVEIELIRFWINAGAVYPGTYAAQGASSGIGWFGGGENNIADIRSVSVASAAIERRCFSCHTGARAVWGHASRVAQSLSQAGAMRRLGRCSRMPTIPITRRSSPRFAITGIGWSAGWRTMILPFELCTRSLQYTNQPT